MTSITLGYRQLSELELALGGAFGAVAYVLPDGGDALGATLRVPGVAGRGLPEPGDALEPHGTLELRDTEGTPVAAVTVDATRAEGDSTWVAGPIVALRPIEHRPFEYLRIAEHRPRVPRALLAEGEMGPDDWTGEFDLVVVADGGDPSATGRLVRAARAALDCPVVVLPVPASVHLDESGRTRLVRDIARDLLADEVIARGRPVTRGRGMTVLFTGFSGSGKSTIAKAVRERLAEQDDREITLLDGDEVRTMLSAGLGFSREDRELNVRRIGWVAALIARHGGVALCAPIAPYEAMRAEMRRMTEEAGGRFVLVHVATPLEVCEARDRKGMYAKARAGLMPGFTGIDDPYDVPMDFDLRIDTTGQATRQSVDTVLELLEGFPV